MKFFIILLVCSLISQICFCQSKEQTSDISSQNSRQQIIHNVSGIDTVCNFDPIAVGNRWVYLAAEGYTDPYQVDYSYCIKEVLQETQINNKTYKVIKNNWPYISVQPIEYERIDTVTGMVYLLDDNNKEFPADSLQAKPNDFFYASRLGLYGTACDSLIYSILFDSLRQTHSYHIPQWMSGSSIFYYLTYGIGISYWVTYPLRPKIAGIYSDLSSVTLQLKGCVINGVLYGDTNYYKYTGIKVNNTVNNFNLSQNFPNPFNPSTRIKYSLAKGENVTLKIYDVLGREIETLVNGYQSSGSYEIEFAPKSLSDGVYIYRLQAGNNYLLKKMIYLK